MWSYCISFYVAFLCKEQATYSNIKDRNIFIILEESKGIQGFQCCLSPSRGNKIMGKIDPKCGSWMILVYLGISWSMDVRGSVGPVEKKTSAGVPCGGQNLRSLYRAEIC